MSIKRLREIYIIDAEKDGKKKEPYFMKKAFVIDAQYFIAKKAACTGVY